MSTSVFQPTLSASPPEGWFAKESITLLAPDGQANIIISSEPLASDIDTWAYASIQGQLLAREFPGYVEHWFCAEPILGRSDGLVRDFSWRPPDGVEVTQIQFYCVIDSRGYTGTATTPRHQFAELEPVLRSTLMSAMVRL